MRSGARRKAYAAIGVVAVLAISGCSGGETGEDVTRTVVVTETVADVDSEVPGTAGEHELPAGQFSFEGSGTQLLEPIDVPADTTLH
jgi:hypothetical protein